MATKLNIAMSAAFAASLFAASAVNAASLEEQLSLSDGSEATSQGYEPRGPAGRPAESAGGVSTELQAQLGLSDGGPAAFPEPETGPQGRSSEGGGSGVDAHLQAQLKVTDGTPQ
ncbi:MAG TPA: hypothetical protein VLE20_00600 [Blastocatellia bacterium]|nr:hypothetical protein [Blastocatellia bacterium]